jgi:voltage-gated potassium channel
MEFTFKFIRLFVFSLELAAPLLLSLIALIIVLGQIVGARESWGRFNSVYWAFITATTVGYGDFRPLKPLSKVLAVLTGFAGIIFTGIMLAVALNAASISFKSIYDINEIKATMEGML